VIPAIAKIVALNEKPPKIIWPSKYPTKHTNKI
jgi:lambda repressor-like predicted transcriptional regulator